MTPVGGDSKKTEREEAQEEKKRNKKRKRAGKKEGYQDWTVGCPKKPKSPNFGSQLTPLVFIG